jgi:hypothetical protein
LDVLWPTAASTLRCAPMMFHSEPRLSGHLLRYDEGHKCGVSAGLPMSHCPFRPIFRDYVVNCVSSRKPFSSTIAPLSASPDRCVACSGFGPAYVYSASYTTTAFGIWDRDSCMCLHRCSIAAGEVRWHEA